MINEIYPHHFNNRYQANKTVGENDSILYYEENMVLLKRQNNETFALPRKSDFQELPETYSFTYLFMLDDTPCFLLWNKPQTENENLVYNEINIFRTLPQQEVAWCIIAGLHLKNWYSQNKYCGNCGGKNKHKEDERALVCTDCQTTIYPKISPAIIVAIISDNKILLARNANFRTNWYSLVAGYVDVGETLEEALIREVKEEVGLDVKNIRYYKSQPWSLSSSIMIGFIAEADASQPILIDNKEITEAKWFTRGNMPNHPPLLGIAGEMIDRFEKGELS